MAGHVLMSEVTVSDTSCADPAWMQHVCRRLSDVLGCELWFEPTEEVGPPSAVPPSHLVWQSPELQGARLTGRLRLQGMDTDSRPVTHSHQSPDLRVIRTAEVFSEVLQRLVDLERQLTEQIRDQLLSELNDQRSHGESLPETVARILKFATTATSSWGTAFFLAEGTTDGLRLRLCHGLDAAVIPQPLRRLAHSPDEAAMRSGLKILTSNELSDQNWLPAGCRTAAVMPLKTTVGCLGTLWCFDRRNRAWQLSETRRLELVASQLSARLERSVLRRDSDARRLLSEELSSASRRHPGRALGPLREDAGLDVAIRTASPAELGGDLCEVWPVGHGKTLLVLGDATGHSVPAALIMSVTRGAFRTLLTSEAPELGSTDQLTSRLNRALCSVTGGEQFMTLIGAIYDSRRGLLSYTNAGHPPLWHLRGQNATPLEAHGIVLGVLEDASYQSCDVPLLPGDWLVGYTDGVSEALSPQRQHFQQSGILRAFQSQPWTSASAAADGIWQAMQRHGAGLPAGDDQTLLVLRVTESSAR